MKYLFIFLPFFAFGNDTIPDHFPWDTIPKMSWVNGDVKITYDTTYKAVWKSCDQHFGKFDHPRRDSVEMSDVTLLAWNGCTLEELKATKFIGYNYSDWIYLYGKKGYISRGARPRKDFIAWYLAGDKWIKPSYVIKEL